MKFSKLAHFFDLISGQASRIEITKLLAHIFNEATPYEAGIISYLSLGIVRPAYQKSQFNYAEKSMLKVLSVLFNQETITRSAVQHLGDLGLYLRQMHWPYTDQELTVEQVYQRLVLFEAISGIGSQEEKAHLLLDLLRQVDAAGASYIIRIILGTMRLGFSAMTLIDGLSWLLSGNKSLHTLIENSYNVCADIGLIAATAKEYGVVGLEHIQPIIGIPIRPAAAERAENPNAVINKIGPCVAQPKLDGFRLQIHVDKRTTPAKIWFFSRNLLDMSSMFPDLVVSLNNTIANASVTTFITEGEAIIYNQETNTFLPFQETVKRKRKHNIEEAAADMPLRLFLFDLLYLNGQPMLSLPASQRRLALLHIFPSESPKNIIKVIEEKKIANTVELENYFNEQISEGLEGLVAKRPEAPYRPGKRNFNWIKLKRHEEGNLDDTIDAVVLGYYYGQGRRAAFGIGAFLAGIYNAANDTFETIAKVGTGLKDADWIDLKLRSDALAVLSKPRNVTCSPELFPDIWVSPELVVVILADEITQSPLHTAAKISDKLGLALRFPRFMGYATDKTATQATTAKEIRELYQQQFVK